MSKTLLKLKVRDTQDIVFEGEVDRITSYNELGPFDIYPMHANFISIIRKQIDLYQNHKKIKEIKIEQAVMKVKKDVVSIFLGIEALTLDEKLLEPETPPEEKNTTPQK
jgi:F0F1-type ATP synthase epsilon subunit